MECVTTEPGANHAIVADGHSRQNRHVRADPHVAPADHRNATRVMVLAQHRQHGVAGGALARGTVEREVDWHVMVSNILMRVPPEPVQMAAYMNQ